MDLIQTLKALSDETRIRILNLLNNGDLCVCELEVLLDISQSNASRHLNKLTNAKILAYYKVVKYVYYKINEEAMSKFPFIKQILVENTSELKICKIDIERLRKYRDSKLTCEELKDGMVCFETKN